MNFISRRRFDFKNGIVQLSLLSLLAFTTSYPVQAAKTPCAFAECTVNVYAWTGEIPENIARQFEQETGITVNLSTFENNEIMFTKLRSIKHNKYDVVMPSSYFITRMKKHQLLQPLNVTQLTNRRHLSVRFQHPDYDPNGTYSVPFIFGITGIFYNQKNLPVKLSTWRDLWKPEFKNKLLLLDDSRELFSMTLLMLGYQANDTDPQHLKQAFHALQQLGKNIKVFSTEMVVPIMIDEDAAVGMAWNGDFYKASRENPHLHFIFPKEGYVMWVDNLAISKYAPHPKAAHAFINFLLRPDIAKQIALKTYFPITNESAKKLLPREIQNNPVIYPDADTFLHAQFQRDPDEKTLELIERYWAELKISF